MRYKNLMEDGKLKGNALISKKSDARCKMSMSRRSVRFKSE